MLQKRNRSTFIKWTKRIALLTIVWLAAHVTYICIDGLRDSKEPADIAIILGNHVYADGSLSPWLQGRVDKALQLYRTKKVKKIFASGGISLNEEGNYPEGDAMKKYLIEKAVPAEDVIADNYGQNSYLTAKDFIGWNKDKQYRSAIVVTQFYHVTRCKYILHKLGFKNVYNAASEVYSWRDIIGTLREVPAFYLYVIKY